jgi:uncharacterized protein (TIGR03067 family)
VSHLVLGLALAVGAPNLKDPPASPDLVGEWVVEAFTFGGNGVPTGARVRLTADGRFVFGAPPPLPTHEGTYTADRSKAPAQIDVGFSAAGASPMVGIFRFDGDALVICFGPADRPTEFAAPAGSRVGLLTLKRAEKE